MNKKSTIKIFLPTVLVAVIAAGGLFAFRRSSSICTPIYPAAQSKEMIDTLDKQSSQFASTTSNITDRSAEGGAQITFTKNGSRKIVEQRFYGETGKSYMRFYYDDTAVFEIVKLNFTYVVPLSVDSSGVVKSSEESDYYLASTGRVCGSEVNGVSRPIDKDTQEMIQEYISGIL
jgi:hypothetical protein